MNGPRASIVIPAHEEGAVIDRCLRSLLTGAEPGELEIVVVCNGCTDDTAIRAGRYGSGVRVIELARASKVDALNAGDRLAVVFPRFYVDADVECPLAAIRDVAAVLGGGDVDCAAPAIEFELEGCAASVRRFYAVWTRLPFLRDAAIGNGVYALSAAGRGRWPEFPDIVADDLYVRNLFAPSERAVVASVHFTVHPPRSLAGLLRVRTRVYRGNAEYSGRFPAQNRQHGRRAAAVATLLRRPRLWGAVATYYGVNVAALAVARWRIHRRVTAWERDDSARSVYEGESGATPPKPPQI